jgi:hypothetical protein
MSELLQFQARNWHPVKQEKHLENAENHSAKDESVVGKNISLKTAFRFKENMKLPEQILKVCTTHQFFKHTFFLLKNCLPKLQRKQICTAVRYIQINQ